MDSAAHMDKLQLAEKQRGALAAEVLRLRGELQTVGTELSLLKQRRDGGLPAGPASSVSSDAARLQAAEREVQGLWAQLQAARDEAAAAKGALAAASRQVAESHAVTDRLRQELQAARQSKGGGTAAGSGAAGGEALSAALARAATAEAEAARLSAALVGMSAKHEAEVQRLRAVAEAAAVVAQDSRALELFTAPNADAERLAERRRLVPESGVEGEEAAAPAAATGSALGQQAVAGPTRRANLAAEAQAEAAITRREALMREVEAPVQGPVRGGGGVSHDREADFDDPGLALGSVQNCLGPSPQIAEELEQAWRASSVVAAAGAIERALQAPKGYGGGTAMVAVPPAARAAVMKMVTAMKDLPRQLALPSLPGDGSPPATGLGAAVVVRPPSAVARVLVDSVCGLVLDCMLALKDHALAAVAGCALLAALAGSVDLDARSRMVYAGAVNAVVAACVAHRRDVAVQQQGCAALEKLAGGSSHLQGKAIAVGAYDAALMALRLHGAQHSAVALAAARALDALAQDGASTMAPSGIPAGPGVRALLACLAHHSDGNPPVAAACCRALANLMFDDALRSTACGAGAPAALVGLMKTHPGVPDLQAAAAIAVAQLALCPDNAPPLHQAGAPRCLVVALRVHGPSSGEAGRHACEALGNLAAYGPTRAQLLASDVLPPLVAALSAHPRDADCARAAAWALQSTLRDGGDPTDAALAAGALPALCAALRRHAAVPRAASRCALALPVLSDTASRRQQALQASALPALTAALAGAGMLDERTAEAALGAAAALASGSLAAGEASALVEACLACMATPLGASSYLVQRRGCVALARLAACARAACVGHAADAAQRVLAASRAFPADSHLAQLACLAIAALASADGLPLPAHGGSDLHGAALQVLRVYVAHPGACAQACATLAATAAATTDCAATWAGLDKAVRAHGGEAPVLEAGLQAVAALLGGTTARASPASAAAAHAVGAPALVCSALRACGTSTALVVAASTAITALARASPALADACVAAGALDAVSQALAAHSTQAQCCANALQALQAVCGEATRTAALIHALPPALPDAAVKAAATHALVAAVVEHSCSLLAALAACDPRQVGRACCAAGAVDAAVAAMNGHPAHVSVVSAAAQALLTLFKPDGAAAGAGPVSGAPAAAEALVAALVTHGGSAPDTGALLSTTLAMVTAVSLEAKARGGAAGGIEASVAVLQAHPGDMQVARGALASLHSMGINTECWARAGAAGTIPACVAVLRDASHDPAAASLAARAIKAVAISDRSVLTLVQAGAPAALVATLRHHPSVVAVAEHAADALACLAKQPQGRAACLAASAAQALVQAQAACASDGRVVERVTAALTALGGAASAGMAPQQPQETAPSPAGRPQAAVVPQVARHAPAQPLASPPVRRPVAPGGDVQSVLAALASEQGAPDAGEAEQLCRSLAAVLSVLPPNDASFATAIAALAAAMLRHQRSQAVAAAAAVALCSLPPHQVGTHPAAVDALLTVIQAQPGAADVLQHAAGCLTACGAAAPMPQGGAQARRAACVLLSSIAVPGIPAPVEARVCDALATLCGVQQLHTTGAVGAAIGALNSHPSDVAVVQHAAAALAARLRPDSDAPEVVAAALEALCPALATHSASPDAAGPVCAALALLLSAAPGLRSRACSAGALEHVCAALRVGHALPGCSQATFAVLPYLLPDADAKRRAAEADAVSCAAASLKAHGPSPEVVVAVCNALTSLTSNHAANKTRAVTARVHELATAALQAHVRDAAVAAAGCAVLSSLAVSAENTAKVAQAGAVPAIVAAMRAHGTVLSVQAQGASALGVLAVSPANQVLVGRTGAVDALVAAVRTHAGAASQSDAATGVLAQCAGALGVCAVDADNAAAALRVGGVEALAAALAAGRSSTTLQQQGCATLGILAAAPGATGEHAVAALAAVLASAQAHAASPAVLDEALGALATCVTHPAALEAASRDGGACVTCVVNALRDHSQHERVQAHALCALGCLVAHPAAEASAVAADALPLVVSAARGASARTVSGRGRGAAAVQHACGCLAAFASGQQGDARVVAAGGIDAVLNAMECCPASPGVAEEALLALAKLCRDPQRRGPVVAAGALEASVAAIRQHEAVDGVQEAGLKALAAMVGGVPANAQRASAAGALQVAESAVNIYGDVPAVLQAARDLISALA